MSAQTQATEKVLIIYGSIHRPLPLESDVGGGGTSNEATVTFFHIPQNSLLNNNSNIRQDRN